MPFSDYLNGKKAACRELVELLGRHFAYVSVLGSDERGARYDANRKSSSAKEDRGEAGFVVKMHDGRSFYEYSFDDFPKDLSAFAETILCAVKADGALLDRQITVAQVSDEPLEKDFLRETDFDEYDDETLLSLCRSLSDEIASKDENVLNAFVAIRFFTVSKLFVTKNRMLTQHYGWANGFLVAVYQQDERVVQAPLFEGDPML